MWTLPASLKEREGEHDGVARAGVRLQLLRCVLVVALDFTTFKEMCYDIGVLANTCVCVRACIHVCLVHLNTPGERCTVPTILRQPSTWRRGAPSSFSSAHGAPRDVKLELVFYVPPAPRRRYLTLKRIREGAKAIRTALTGVRPSLLRIGT